MDKCIGSVTFLGRYRLRYGDLSFKIDRFASLGACTFDVPPQLLQRLERLLPLREGGSQTY